MKITPITFIAIFLTTLASMVMAQEQHDCVPYEPTEAGGSFDSNWAAGGERDQWQFTVPDDPGGGYVTVTLTTEHPDVVTALDITTHPISGGIILGGIAGNPGPKIIAVYEAAAGQAYNLSAYQGVAAPPGDHPVDYSLDWVFTSKVDCYEPNNAEQFNWPEVLTAAKAIPLDLAVTATSIVGYDQTGIRGARLFDWYKFTLNEPTKIIFGTFQVPKDVKVGLRLFNQAGGFVLDAPKPEEVGGTTRSVKTELPAGTYYLEFFPEERGVAAVRPLDGIDIPDHFDMPYIFGVADKIPWGCLGAILCDGFETPGVP